MVEKIIQTCLNLGNGHYEIMAISTAEMAISMVTEQALRKCGEGIPLHSHAGIKIDKYKLNFT